MTEERRVHDIPEDAEVFRHIDENQPVSLSGVQKTFQHAIRAKRLVFMVYSGSLRLVEPTCVGFGDQGQLLVRVYQRAGATSVHGEWRLFRGDKVEGLWESPCSFEIRPDFRAADSAFAVISAELTRDAEEQ